MKSTSRSLKAALIIGLPLVSAPDARAQFSLFNASFNSSPTGAVTNVAQLNSGTSQGTWEILNAAGAATVAGGISGSGATGEDRAAAFAHNTLGVTSMTQIAAVNVTIPTVFTPPANTKIADSSAGTRVIARLANPAELSASPVIDLDFSAFGNSNSGAFKYCFIRGLDASGSEIFECLYQSGSQALPDTRKFFLRGATDNETTWTSATAATPEGTLLADNLPLFSNVTVSTGPLASQWLGLKIQLSPTGVVYALDTDNDGTSDITSSSQPINSTASTLDRLEFSIRTAAVDNQNKGFWLNNVSVTAAIPDTDNDGMPNAWEMDNRTDPFVNDSADDPDLDLLTNLQEYLRGTNPNEADTDADGLSDKVETNTGAYVSASDTGTNPRLPDTDGDQLLDAVETNTGTFVNAGNTGSNPHKADSDEDLWNDGLEVTNSTNPTLSTSPGGANPPAIGITFASSRGTAINLPFPPTAFAGHPDAVQKNWNHTLAYGTATSGSTADIVSPSAGALVDSSGAATSTQISYTMSSAWSLTHSPGTPFGRLFSGYLEAVNAGSSVNISLLGIPYPRYDVYVYCGADVNGRTGSVSNAAEGSPRFFTSGNNPASAGGISTGSFARSVDVNATYYPIANYVLFTGLTNPDLDLTYTRGNAAGGVYAVQIVARPDMDSDGMSDQFETTYGLNPVFNDAGLDLDTDGSSNLNEHNLGTIPNDSDTDDDGLKDGAETDTGNWNSPADTGTNPLKADTDGDGLVDGVETNNGTFVNPANTGTNPLNLDTDDDLWSDGIEITNGSNPLNSASPGGANPAAIGISFGSLGGASPNLPFPATAYAGHPNAVQKNWNHTQLSATTAGSTADVLTPNSGVLTDSAGNPTNVQIAFTMATSWSTLQTPGTPFARLFNGYLDTSPTTTTATVTISDIPYSKYDVYVYVGAGANGRTGRISSTTAGNVTYSFITSSNATVASGIPTGTFTATTNTGNGNPMANYARFADQTSPVFDLSYLRGSDNGGIYGIQIVKAATGGFTAWQELKFGADAGNLTIAGPNADPDKDGIPNLLEYALEREPTTASLLDLQYTANGSIVSIRYTPSADATDVTLIPQWSQNLTDWSATGITVTGSPEKTASLPQGPELKKFLRLKASLP